jgi:hypothetical protein
MGFHKIRYGWLYAAIAWGAVSVAPAQAIPFQLNASNIQFDDPSPLFTSNQVGGILQLSDSVAPGAGFGLAQIIDFTFNFGGIAVTFPETQLPGGDITAFGTRSADGRSLSFLDLRFDLPSTVAPCSLICAGQIQIGTFDRSNFVAIDDPDTLTTSLVVFDAALVAVPEPSTLAIFGMALAGMIGMLRQRKLATEKGSG